MLCVIIINKMSKNICGYEVFALPSNLDSNIHIVTKGNISKICKIRPFYKGKEKQMYETVEKI